MLVPCCNAGWCACVQIKGLCQNLLGTCQTVTQVGTKQSQQCTQQQKMLLTCGNGPGGGS